MGCWRLSHIPCDWYISTMPGPIWYLDCVRSVEPLRYHCSGWLRSIPKNSPISAFSRSTFACGTACGTIT